jgi:polysaccharide deacetylase family protein (PEP-CTERM system associated)
MKNILTFDIEEYFQVENFKNEISFDSWDSYESRVEVGVNKILNLLKEYKVTATFFILGWVAERHPAMIKKIADSGHEVASHGYAHELIYKQTPEEFKCDLYKSIKILEGITGKKVESYRAPCFSITKESSWALDILLEAGIKYDSSIFPIHHDRYGIPDADWFPHVIRKKGDLKLKELPISTIEMFGKRIPFAGGGYLRLLPRFLIAEACKSINQYGHQMVLYLHPWEFDTEQPRIKTTWLNSFRHYLNIPKTEKKMRYFLKTFRFCSIRDYFGAAHPSGVTQKEKSVSIVIPIFNEEECVEKMFHKVQAEAQKLKREYEIILVDDGSKDNTPHILRTLAQKNSDLKVVRFRRNYGQTPAMVAGFDHATKDIIITMDGDLQNDPADMQKLLDKMDEGYEIVSGWRYKRQDKFLTRKLPSMVANKLISISTGVNLHDYGCSLKAYKRECIQSVHAYAEMHRFFPAVASITGARTAEIPVNHYARTMGKSKYGLSRTFKVFADLFTMFLITKFSTRPTLFFAGCSVPFVFAAFGLFVLEVNGFLFERALVINSGIIILLLILGMHFLFLAFLSALIITKGKYKPSQLCMFTAEKS